MSLRTTIPAKGAVPRKTILVEVFLITVAVALGFLVTEWREGLQKSHQAQAALVSITEELRLNRDQLADKLPYYQHITAVLDSIVVESRSESVDGTKVDRWRGFNPPVLKRAAYEAASVTGALSNMEFSIASAVAEAYLIQDRVESTFDWTLQAFVSGQIEDWADGHRIFHLLLEVMRTGVQTYDFVLARLSTEEPPGASH